MTRHIVHIDATPGERRGAAGVGIVERTLAGTIVRWHQQIVQADTNNVAEYQALLVALQTLQARDVWIVSDSQLVVQQVLGQCRVRQPLLQGLVADARRMLAAQPGVRLLYAPRQLNRLADALAWDTLCGWGQMTDYLLVSEGGQV